MHIHQEIVLPVLFIIIINALFSTDLHMLISNIKVKEISKQSVYIIFGRKGNIYWTIVRMDR
jgi:hypothetical protein